MFARAVGDCCHVHRYAKLNAQKRDFIHLSARDPSEDHDTLRSATPRETHVKSRTAVKELAVRKAIVACVYAGVKR